MQAAGVPIPYQLHQRNLPGLKSRRSFAGICSRRINRVATLAAKPDDEDYVSYEGEQSVFPAEAGEEVGTSVEGFGKEVKPKPSPPKEVKAVKQPDRDYVDYKEKKTVFPGEACDELGGDFCESEYQEGVFPDKVASKK
ncbi:hypothetical protein SELMODRAFT_444139 [Selaginella moellendorffii]|uniref:Light-regulated protein n=1 Tax=Selaginella moellendorffii TaxID=88036 RepID=D8S797_SELML|nr:light-regulated protein, chloroplastic [Selaginella moellendorffii]EFJ19718.1 hypothetical protein SELMODRAFT_444139 [Selaginella moellendorffii]|eukprot:XP_002979310.1 light-regulated protein, chloroplastic [Selaginella moellendorffii]